MTRFQKSAPWGDGCAGRSGDKDERVAEKQRQAWPVSWRNAVVGGQRSIGVCVDRLKPGLERTKELAKPLKQAQDLVHGSTMNMASDAENRG